MKPDAILCADLHLRDDQPTCRTDDFWTAQWEAVKFIKGLQEKFDCPVLCAGDLLHRWKASPHLLSACIEHLPKKLYTVLGQHDLPQHSLDLLHKSGVWTLVKAGVVNLLDRFHFGTKPDGTPSVTIRGRKILVWHELMYTKPPFPGLDRENKALKTLKELSYDLILTGDNHETFVVEYQGRLLVNPGSMTKQTAAQIDHKPCIFLYYAKRNKVRKVYIPSEQDPSVITREHIEAPEQLDKRIKDFLDSLSETWIKGLSFEENLERVLHGQDIPESVKQIVLASIEGGAL